MLVICDGRDWISVRMLLLLDWSSNDWVFVGIGLWLDSRFQIFEFFDRSYCNLKARFSGVVQVLSNGKILRILADIGLAKAVEEDRIVDVIGNAEESQAVFDFA